MKKVALYLFSLFPLLLHAQPPEAVKQFAITQKTVSPELVRVACVDAVRRLDTKLVTNLVRTVTMVPSNDDATARCVIDAQIKEESGYGTFRTHDVKYVGVVGLSTGRVTIDRIDEGAAQQAAQLALASMFINLKASTISSNTIAYSGVVQGKKCTVEVGADPVIEPKRWLVKSVYCK